VRSLRGRLTVGLSLVLAVVLGVAGVLAARVAERSERAALDDRLQRTADLSRATALVAVESELPLDDDRLDAVLSATATSLRLVIGSTALIETGRAPRAPRRLPTGLSTFSAGGVRYRASVTSLREAALGGLARIEVVTSLAPLERRQAQLRRRLLLLGLIALAVGAAGVHVASRVVLRPLSRLRAATAAIAGDEDLGRRAPDGAGPTETRALAGSFNDMLGRLSRSAADRERALAATQRFAAGAGHELRTPSTAVQATLSALARHPAIDADRRGRMLAEALEQQRRLVALLDGLQALARGDAAPATAPVDLVEVVDAGLAAAAERHPAVAWDAALPEAPVMVDGWEPGLRALVDNLLENAARHGRPDGGSVRVTVTGEPQAAVRVEDDGPGIPAEERERVLEPFVRLGDHDRPPGSGLGLALVAQQAARHGAALAVEDSAELGGATFAVRWPAATP